MDRNAEGKKREVGGNKAGKAASERERVRESEQDGAHCLSAGPACGAACFHGNGQRLKPQRCVNTEAETESGSMGSARETGEDERTATRNTCAPACKRRGRTHVRARVRRRPSPHLAAWGHLHHAACDSPLCNAHHTHTITHMYVHTQQQNKNNTWLFFFLLSPRSAVVCDPAAASV